MSTDKKVTDVPEVTPEWIEEQCRLFEATLLGFTDAMRVRFREKAREGRGRWQRAEFAERLYQQLLATAAGMPLAAGAEADCANFLAFLWRLNREKPELAVRPVPGPRPMLSGYGLKADLELARQLLDMVREVFPPGEGRGSAWLHSLDPEAAINLLNERAQA